MGHTLTGTLTKNISHEIRGPKKSMQKLGLAVNTGIGRDPFSDPVLSIWKKITTALKQTRIKE